MITKDSKAARAFIEFLKMPLAHEIWMAQGGFVTPLKLVNKDAYASDALRSWPRQSGDPTAKARA